MRLCCRSGCCEAGADAPEPLRDLRSEGAVLLGVLEAKNSFEDAAAAELFGRRCPRQIPPELDPDVDASDLWTSGG